MKFIELFAGIGGIRCGLEKANDTITEGVQQGIQQGSKNNPTAVKPLLGTKQFTCVWANEWDKYACQIYRKNFGEGELYEGDIKGVAAETVPDHALLTAGFPCPTYSIAGKRKGFDEPQGIVFFEICRIAEVKKPRLLLLENVKGLLNHKGGETFAVILNSLSELGYDCEWEVLNSKNFGVPQNRERVFIVGHLRGEGGQKVFPIGEADSIYPETDEQIIHTIDSNYHKGWLDNQQRTMVMHNLHHHRTGESVNGLKCLGIIPESIKEKGNYLPRERVFDSRGEARAISTIQNQMPYYTDKTSIRRLTPTECERLQGFPDGWTEGISDTQRYKCLGNAVTINVIKEIGNRLN